MDRRPACAPNRIGVVGASATAGNYEELPRATGLAGHIDRGRSSRAGGLPDDNGVVQTAVGVLANTEHPVELGVRARCPGQIDVSARYENRSGRWRRQAHGPYGPHGPQDRAGSRPWSTDHRRRYWTHALGTCVPRPLPARPSIGVGRAWYCDANFHRSSGFTQSPSSSWTSMS